jgi:hypothetical protein
MSSNSTDALNSQLVTLKWCEIVSIGWNLSEKPPADMMHATWLIQAIAAAQILQPSYLVCYLDTFHLVVNSFESVCGTFSFAFLHQFFSMKMTVSEQFLPFKEVVSNLCAVRDCFGLIGFRNLVDWTLVAKRVRKCFAGTWSIGTIFSYNLHGQWFSVQYCDGTEEYSPSELVVIYYSALLPSAIFWHFILLLYLVWLLLMLGPSVLLSLFYLVQSQSMLPCLLFWSRWILPLCSFMLLLSLVK